MDGVRGPGNSEPVVPPDPGVLLDREDKLRGKKVTEGGTKAGNGTVDKDGVVWMKEDKKGKKQPKMSWDVFGPPPAAHLWRRHDLPFIGPFLHQVTLDGSHHKRTRSTT